MMNRLLRSCVLIFSAFLFTAPLSGIDWPLGNPELLSTFGSNEGSHFSVGVRVTGAEKSVRPVEDGEVVFYWDEEQKKHTLPCGLGNVIVMEHSNELKTIYGHLEDAGTGADPEYVKSARDVLGRIGNSGWTFGNNLFFAVFDSEFNQFVNPLLILPSTPDSQSPQIRRAALQYGDTTIFLQDGIRVSPGEYQLTAEIFDVSDHARVWNSRAPFTILVYLNGSEAARIVFEAIQNINDEVVLQRSDLLSYGELYMDKWRMILGTYTLIPGITGVEIIVKDYVGNESSRIYQFEVVD